MLSTHEALQNLLTAFSQKTFPKSVALTIIHRASGDHSTNPMDRWSIGNQLIAAIIGKTSYAATFNQFLKAGRIVKKGSKAFGIFAPITAKKKEVSKSGEETEKVIIVGYKQIPVFAIEQTVPIDGMQDKTQSSYNYRPDTAELPPFLDVAEKLNIKIRWKPVHANAYGYYDRNTSSITLCSQDHFVYFHELSHAVNATFSDLKDTDKAEIIAETCAAVLCEMQGIHGYECGAMEYVRRYCQDKSDNGVIRGIMGCLNDIEKIINIIITTSNQPPQ